MTRERGQGSQPAMGAFAAPRDPARPLRVIDLLGEDGRNMGEPRERPAEPDPARHDLGPSKPRLRRRFRDRLLDWGWWPEPLTEHWVLIDRERQREIDILTDQLVVMLMTSRSVGAGMKTKVRRQHNLIRVARLYRWRRAQ